ncbi:MAG: DNA alkylation repair protein [Planctomycetaceae bacterium]|nr:DNA alkylation repair protein [Planctomycetaceae bacterium]
MTLREAMSVLESMGTAQNRKVYQRHGSDENVFGVSFGNLRPLAKKIGTDHQLAEELWSTGNSDARTLAIQIADPNEFTAASADAWLADISYYLLSDLFAPLIARSRLAKGKLSKWTRSRKEFVRRCGYVLLSSLLKDHPEMVDDALCCKYLDTIEQQIHNSANYARHAMNMSVAAIGIYRPSLRNEALAAAKRIGKVEVDHGETGCRTPDAASYIRKAVSR